MTITNESDTDRERFVGDIVECLGDIEQLQWKFPISSLMDHDDLSQEIQDSLDRLVEAAAVMRNEGPNILWAFAAATDLADDVRRAR